MNQIKKEYITKTSKYELDLELARKQNLDHLKDKFHLQKVTNPPVPINNSLLNHSSIRFNKNLREKELR